MMSLIATSKTRIVETTPPPNQRLSYIRIAPRYVEVGIDKFIKIEHAVGTEPYNVCGGNFPPNHNID